MFSIDNIILADHGYYINVDSSIDRRHSIEQLIQKYDIKNISRFSALTDPLRQSACTKSHIGIFKDALNKEYESICIFEDDIDILNNCTYINNISVNFTSYLSSLKQEIDHIEWDLIALGINPNKKLIPISPKLAINSGSTGSWAYIINKKAYKYIIDNFNYYKDYLAIDNIIPLLNTKGFRSYCTIPMIIKHKDGFQSDIAPHVGKTFYSGWIEGSWLGNLYEPYHLYSANNLTDMENKIMSNSLVERKLTIVIAGHFCENFLFYLRYLFKSLNNRLLNCKFIVVYDQANSTYENNLKLQYYFKDFRDVNVDIYYSDHGLISSINKILPLINTEYFLFLEHDWIFLNKESIDFENLINAFDNYSFIQSVWFNKDDNQLKGFEIGGDVNGNETPYGPESRVENIDLTTTIRWSNNPAIHRTSTYKKLFETYVINPYIDSIHQGSNNVEESLIKNYREELSKDTWLNVRDKWGTFLYGKIGDGPFIGHLDASKRYQSGSHRTMSEDNADEYIKNNPLLESD
jgi:GR25 family glycosyltransferase involved in LPS biosynthesis